MRTCIEATCTSDTSMIATEIAKDKSLAYRILSDLGLPVPKQSVVYTLKRIDRPLHALPRGRPHLLVEQCGRARRNADCGDLAST